MSVALPIEEDTRFRRYTASAGQKVFSIPFPFQQNDDINILLNKDGLYSRAAPHLYSIQGAGDPVGGTIVFHNGREKDEVIAVVGRTILDRLSSVVRDGRFSSKLIDDELDRNRIIQQEQQRDIDRSLKFDFGTSFSLIQKPEDGRSLIWRKDGSLLTIANGPDPWKEVDRLNAAISLIGQAGSIAEHFFESNQVASLALVKPTFHTILTGGKFTNGDGEGGLYIDNDNGASDTFKSGDGRTWYLVSDVSSKRLNDNIKFSLMPDFQSKSKININISLPSGFPDAQTIISDYGYNRLYPQGIVLDEKEQQLLTLFNPHSGNGWCWVEVRTWPDLAYVSCFSAGGQYNEGAVISHEGGKRFLEIGMGSGTNKIGKYDITNLPANKTRITPIKEWDVGFKVQVSGNGNKRLLESASFPIGVRRKHIHTIRDNEYNRVGIVDFGIYGTGSDLDPIGGTSLPDTSQALLSEISKSQGTMLSGGFIAHAMGGFWDRASTISDGFSNQGVKIFNWQGELISEILIPAKSLSDILTMHGYNVDRIETEGGFITSDGKIFTLIMIKSGAFSNSDVTGRLLVQWYSLDKDSIDVANYIASSKGGAKTAFTNGRVSSLINPLNGKSFTSLSDILDYMTSLDETYFQFAAAKFPDIKDLVGDDWPAYSIVEIFMLDNWSWRIRAKNLTNEYEYQISEIPRSQNKRWVRGEGIFSPALKIGGTESGINYVNKSGAWRVSNSICTFEYSFQLSSKGIGVGDIELNLPVQPLRSSATAIVRSQNMTAVSGSVYLSVSTSGTATFFHNGATGNVNLRNENLKDDSILRGSIIYHV